MNFQSRATLCAGKPFRMTRFEIMSGLPPRSAAISSMDNQRSGINNLSDIGLPKG